MLRRKSMARSSPEKGRELQTKRRKGAGDQNICRQLKGREKKGGRWGGSTGSAQTVVIVNPVRGNHLPDGMLSLQGRSRNAGSGMVSDLLETGGTPSSKKKQKRCSPLLSVGDSGPVLPAPTAVQARTPTNEGEDQSRELQGAL